MSVHSGYFAGGSEPSRFSLGSVLEEKDGIVAELSAFFTGCGLAVIDRKVDGIDAAQLKDRIVLLHHGQKTQEREITMPDGSIRPVVVPPNSIVEIPLP